MQASNPGKQEGNAGTFRATFEDKPLMSDIVFLRAWIGVDLPRFYNPVTNYLTPKPQPQLVSSHKTSQQLSKTGNSSAMIKRELRRRETVFKKKYATGPNGT